MKKAKKTKKETVSYENMVMKDIESDTEYNFSPNQINELDDMFENAGTVRCSFEDISGSIDY